MSDFLTLTKGGLTYTNLNLNSVVANGHTVSNVLSVNGLSILNNVQMYGQLNTTNYVALQSYASFGDPNNEKSYYYFTASQNGPWGLTEGTHQMMVANGQTAAPKLVYTVFPNSDITIATNLSLNSRLTLTSAGVATTNAANAQVPVVVNTNLLTANSSVLLTPRDFFSGSVSAYNVIPGVSFSFSSSNASDNGKNVSYLIVN